MSVQVDVAHEIEVDGTRVNLVVTTRHGADTVRTVVHAQDALGSVGGARITVDGTLTECVHLAANMTDKCAAARLLMTGQKTVATCPGGVPKDVAARARLLAEHQEQVIRVAASPFFGPDMNVNEEVQEAIAERSPRLRPFLTGMSAASGELDIDRNGFTARGLVHALAAARRSGRARVETIAIQGAGAVGLRLAQLADREGFRIRAISNVTGALRGPESGLDVDHLAKLLEAIGDAGLAAYAASRDDAEHVADPDSLFQVEADVFAPCARTMVLTTPSRMEHDRQENARVHDVERFHAAARPRVILQGANHPLSHEAEAWLEARGVLVLPDVLVNGGGVIGCVYGSAWRDEVREERRSADDVARDAITHAESVIEDNVAAVLASTDGCRAAVGRIVAERRAAMLPAAQDLRRRALQSFSQLR